MSHLRGEGHGRAAGGVECDDLELIPRGLAEGAQMDNRVGRSRVVEEWFEAAGSTRLGGKDSGGLDEAVRAS